MFPNTIKDLETIIEASNEDEIKKKVGEIENFSCSLKWDHGVTEVNVIPEEISVLHYFAARARPNVMKYFLDQHTGFDVNITSETGKTPLHFAVQYRNRANMEILLHYGVDANIQETSNGYSPLHLACQNNDIGAVMILLQRNPDTTLKDRHGRTAESLANIERISSFFEDHKRELEGEVAISKDSKEKSAESKPHAYSADAKLKEHSERKTESSDNHERKSCCFEDHKRTIEGKTTTHHGESCTMKLKAKEEAKQRTRERLPSTDSAYCSLDSAESKQNQGIGTEVDIDELKKHFQQLISILTEGLQYGILGCYLDSPRNKIVVDISSSKKTDAKKFLEQKFQKSKIQQFLTLEKFDHPPQYCVHKGLEYLESGSQIFITQKHELVDMYNNQVNNEEKRKLLEGVDCFSLGYFAKDVENNDTYILTAMHPMGLQKGKRRGQCSLLAIIGTGNDQKAFRISDGYIGWIGGYLLGQNGEFPKKVEAASNLPKADDSSSLNKKEELVFLDIAAFKLKDGIPTGKIRYCATTENNHICEFVIPTRKELNSKEFIDKFVQKWGSNTGLTFGQIRDTDYWQSKYGESCGGIIRIECINRKVVDFASHGDSGAFVNSVSESTLFKNYVHFKFRDETIETGGLIGYGLISSSAMDKGISLATQLCYSLEMFKEKFNLDLKLCSSE